MKYQLCIAMLTAMGAVSSADAAVSTVSQSPTFVTKSQKFHSTLKSSGAEVLQGNWNLFSVEDCKYAIAKTGMCFGNNPAAPYVIPTLPLWPDEFNDPSMKDLFGPTPGDHSWTHRLGEREALVIMGTLPPPGGHFGIQSYIFTRQGTINTNDEIYRTMQDPFIKNILFATSPNPARTYLFASVADGHNDVTIDQQSGSSWNQERVFIVTADAAIERKIADSLVASGVVQRNQIFSQHVSGNLARIGLGSSADDFLTLIRYAMPYDESAGNRWRQAIPLSVFRVRDKDTVRPTEPFPIAPRAERVAKSELYLQSDLNHLVHAVKQRWGQSSAEEVPFQSLRVWVDLLGEHCLSRPMNCLGDNSDADYQIGKSSTLDQGEVIAVVGTLATATGNARYVSLSANWLPPLVGALNRSHFDLIGSAASFANTVNNTDKFYVHYFARNCFGIPNCSTVTEAMVPKGDVMKVIQRNYIVPGTARGADPALVLNPITITFKPQSNQ